ncbi:hypothetical protein N018_15920 [Pseudomonas syringae CC1557]|uniref:Uncharacterized protein n=1 Tax=Pseudomonas syringae CC1557 TaxID=1357279 RepID=W0MYY0_PSESX|nr:hypothetical protein N018_15920 [Pseudomonas syringae CC1557]
MRNDKEFTEECVSLAKMALTLIPQAKTLGPMLCVDVQLMTLHVTRAGTAKPDVLRFY